MSCSTPMASPADAWALWGRLPRVDDFGGCACVVVRLSWFLSQCGTREHSKSLHLLASQVSSYEDMKEFTEAARCYVYWHSSLGCARFFWTSTALTSSERGPRTILMPDAKSLSSRGSTAFISATEEASMAYSKVTVRFYNSYKHTCSMHVALRCDSTAYHRSRLECWWCSASWCHC